MFTGTVDPFQFWLQFCVAFHFISELFICSPTPFYLSAFYKVCLSTKYRISMLTEDETFQIKMKNVAGFSTKPDVYQNNYRVQNSQISSQVCKIQCLLYWGNPTSSKDMCTRIRDSARGTGPHIFKHLEQTTDCRTACSSECFKVIDHETTLFSIKLKEALRIKW